MNSGLAACAYMIPPLLLDPSSTELNCKLQRDRPTVANDFANPVPIANPADNGGLEWLVLDNGNDDVGI
jgi:hypothetical protein